MAEVAQTINIGTWKDRQIFMQGFATLAAFDAAGNSVLPEGVTKTSSLVTSNTPSIFTGGLGDVEQFRLTYGGKLEITATFADNNLYYTKVNTGAELRYGAAIPQNYSFTLDATKKVTLPLGVVPVIEEASTYSKPIARIDGKAYQLDDANSFIFAQGEVGKSYCCAYFINGATATKLALTTSLIGDIVRLVIIAPLYAKPIAGQRGSSALIGYRFYHVPYAQAAGTDTQTLDQTAQNNASITFSALPYDETGAAGDACTSGKQYLAYYVDYIFDDGGYTGVNDIFVEGVISAKESAKMPLSVRMVKNGVAVPVTDINDFNFTLDPVSLGTVAIVGGVATFTAGTTGTGTLKVQGKSTPVSTNVDISRLKSIEDVTVTA